MEKSILYLLVNFGGPRTLTEIEPFLKELLCDKDVIRTGFPQCVHNFLFSRVAKKRAKKIAPDYALIGGRSPIYEDTEEIAKALRKMLKQPVYTFHRYLPTTHKAFLNQLKSEIFDEIIVFPLFPQFSYATTGSIARWFLSHLPKATVDKMRWVKSYAANRFYIDCCTKLIKEYYTSKNLLEEETVLFFSAHGLPQAFIDTGDPYQNECISSYEKMAVHFPQAKTLLAYQSQFGKQEWMRPYTGEMCNRIKEIAEERKNIVFFPLSFTSDHVETLFEIEYQYLPLIKEQGLIPYRCPALNLRVDWLESLPQILQGSNLALTQDLIYQ